MTAASRPPKVTVRDVPAMIDLAPARPPLGSATQTLVRARSVPPYALEKRSRIRRPPADTLAVCRTVLSWNTAPPRVNDGGGRFAGSHRCGAAVQVEIQFISTERRAARLDSSFTERRH